MILNHFFYIKKNCVHKRNFFINLSLENLFVKNSKLLENLKHFFHPEHLFLLNEHCINFDCL